MNADCPIGRFTIVLTVLLDDNIDSFVGCFSFITTTLMVLSDDSINGPIGRFVYTI